MVGKNSWIGYECEGRLHGILTFFIRYRLVEIPKNIHHVYFTREFLETKNYINDIEEIIEKGYIVTIETNQLTFKNITPNMHAKCHIIFRIEEPLVHKLKNTDSIMIDGDYFHTICFTNYQGLKVNPGDYAHDYQTISNDN